MKKSIYFIIIVGILLIGVIIGAIVISNMQKISYDTTSPTINELSKLNVGEKNILNISPTTAIKDVLSSYGVTGMKILNYSVNNQKIESVEYKNVDYNLTTTFSITPQKYINGDNEIQQEVYIRNNKLIEQTFNFSTIIQIDYNEVTWNGTKYKLTDKPIIFGSWIGSSGNLIVPNIFFDDVYNKRINYKDVAEQGGYAIGYFDGKNNIIELKIDNEKVSPLSTNKIDPIYVNNSDGFKTTDFGSDAPRGITTNGSDFWITDTADYFVYHIDRLGNNITDGFSTTSYNSRAPYGITINVTSGSPTDFWFVDDRPYLSHTDKLGNNLTGLDLSSIPVISVRGVTTNGSDFWITSSSGFVYHIDRLGNNMTDGFAAADFGAAIYLTGITTNGSDLWIILDYNGGNPYQVFNTNKAGVNLTRGFSYNTIGSGDSLGIAKVEDDFWITDNADNFIYHLSCSDCLPPDTEYPQFTNYWDNNGTQYDGGTGYFNVTVTSTNGTVVLTYNNTNYTASNWSNPTTFNVTLVGITNGTYPYNWSSWGNGTAHNINVSNARSYFVNSEPIPIVTLISPANDTNFTTNSISFNCSAEINNIKKINNVSLWINGIRNYTLASGTSNFTELYISRSLIDGNYNWVCSADDNVTAVKTGWASNNRTLTIDTTSPVITSALNLTDLTTSVLPINSTWNYSATDTHIGNCYYNTSVMPVYNPPETITCNSTIQTEWTTGGLKTIWYSANDTFGHFTTNSTSLYVNYYNATRPEFLTSAIEGNINAISINVSATNLTTASANITYNGTTYVMSGISNGTFARFSVNLTAPAVTAPEDINFSILVLINGATSLYLGNYSQFIYHIEGVTFASSCADRAYNFTLVDEQNFTILNGSMDYNLKWGTTANNTKYSSYGRLEGVKSFYLCINSSIPSNWSVGEGEIFYRSNGYVDRRYYIFTGQELTNNTINITLYNLISAIQTSFQLVIEDTSLNPYVDIYSALIRWYPDLNEYNVVDMGKTDEKGTTIIHIRSEDVDYRIGVYYKNGTLIKLAEPIRMVCLASPCTYTLKISPSETDYTSKYNIQYSLTFNATSGIWTYIFSDPSQKTSQMNLTIYKLTSLEKFPVCSNVVAGYAGAITCNSSLYTSGTLVAEVYRSASPPQLIIQSIYQFITSVFKSSFGLWLSLLLALPIIIFFAIVSPIGALFGGVIALIPALYFGSVNIGIVGGLAILGGIIAHFVKKTR